MVAVLCEVLLAGVNWGVIWLAHNNAACTHHTQIRTARTPVLPMQRCAHGQVHTSVHSRRLKPLPRLATHCSAGARHKTNAVRSPTASRSRAKLRTIATLLWFVSGATTLRPDTLVVA